MKFHWPSFMLGLAAGYGWSRVAERFRPVVLEVTSNLYRAADAIVARVLIVREDLEDLLAEARARATVARPVTH